MQPEKQRIRTFTRRTAVLGGVKLALFGGLAARMYFLQVVESPRYRMLADENRINLRLLPPPRGHIVDRYGVPLAINVHNYRVVIVPEQAIDVPATLDTLSQLIEITDYDRKRVLREVRRKRAFVPITVRENLSWSEVSRIEVNAPDLPGISIEVGQSRYYPAGATAAHVMGYVAAVSERDLTGDPLLELPGFRIGKSGIEHEYDLVLRGSAGNSQVEVNALGRVIRELRRQEGRPGQRLILTLDMELQRFAMRRLSGLRSASVVVMDVHSGDILAMVSTPSFDPNAFNEGLSAREWRALVENPDAPLTNKVIAGQYAPGSTFKIAVTLAALENGVAPDYRVFCPGFMELGDQRFHCWKRNGHGLINMPDAVRESCDVYFYDIALKLGVDRIAEMARRLGLGHRLDIDLPGEKPGLIPTRAWKKRALGRSWRRGETPVAGIGQGYVLATPLQLVVMLARVVNGGYAVTPHLTRPALDDGSPTPSADALFPPLGLSERALKVLDQALDEAVNHPLGTAYRARILEPGRAMGGKTGTSQVRRITMAEREKGKRKNEDLPWRERDHALFVGYAPVDRPRYAVAVVVEHGGSGARAAAPIARDVLREIQERRDPRTLAAGPVVVTAGLGGAGGGR